MDNFLDFNSANNQGQISKQINIEEIRRSLLHRINEVLNHLLPQGYIQNHCYYAGDVEGGKGKSLVVQLQGNKQGCWHDFATNQGGDLLNLWSEVRGYGKNDFPKLLAEINEWLGNSSINPTIWKNQPVQKSPPIDTLGKPSKSWNYFDQNNRLSAVVYRYDNENGKQFRIWDVKNKKSQAPKIRPLYNIPGILASKKVIIVEGEKSADALIESGFTATTAMCGANAPLEKTDWSHLKDKEVTIWPDNDDVGINYANKLAEYLSGKCSFISVLTPPEGKKDKWDAYDAVAESFDVRSFLNTAKDLSKKLPSFTISELLSDISPMPQDLIFPRLLTPGGLLLIGGAPKVGKSDFLINFLIHMAAGESFLGLKPPRPLRIFYLQAEIGYHYMRERVKKLKVSKEIITKSSNNLVSTSNIQMILNDEGIDTVYKTIKHNFGNNKIDILCIDPIRNLFDGGSPNSSENDNNAMLFFLQNRIEKLRSLLNPDMGIILCHHTKKIKKKDLEEDPFQAFSGAGSLRSFYSSGLILHRPDELDSRIHLYFELRNGSSIPRKIIEKEDNKWVELNPFSERLISQDYGNKLDAERHRKSDVILDLISEEALKGNLYTSNQFAEKFESKASLGGIRTINDRISVLATKGYIKFIKETAKLGYPEHRSKYGLMCIEDMKFADQFGNQQILLPTHFKCPNTGAVLPVENGNVWILHEEERS
ncbi:AAA family ATPase [Rickettsiales bacterium]|nr:AAA family ATPase [Rickettsiales bacterium]